MVLLSLSTQYLLQYVRIFKHSGLAFIWQKWFINTLLHKDIQHFWYTPSCSSGWTRKHAFMNIFVIGHQRIILTGVLPIQSPKCSCILENKVHWVEILSMLPISLSVQKFPWREIIMDSSWDSSMTCVLNVWKCVGAGTIENARWRMAVSWDYYFETWYANFNEHLGW